MQRHIDKWGFHIVLALFFLGTLTGCAARQVKPITAESKLDPAAVAASMGPEVMTRMIISPHPTIAGKKDTTVIIETRPRSSLDVVASRDTTGKVTIKSGDTTKVLDIKSSNATVASADKDIKSLEIKTRGKSDRADSKYRWPCLIGCGGVPGGMMYDPMYGGQQYQYQPQVVDPRVGMGWGGFGHGTATGRNVVCDSRGRCY